MLRLISRDLDNLHHILWGVIGGHILGVCLLLFAYGSGAQHIIVLKHAHTLRSVPHARLKIGSLHRGEHQKTAVTQKSPVQKSHTGNTTTLSRTKKKIKKNVPKKAAVKEKQHAPAKRKEQKISQKIVKKPEQIVKPMPAQAEQVSAPESIKQQVASVDVTHNQVTDQEAIRYQEVYAAVMRVWQPPRGIRVVKPAVLHVSVDSHGIVVNSEIIESSGVVAFDVAARRASTGVSYPRAVWSSMIVIKFM
jgi:hypothetical protein